jgi:hypothetical protein
MPDQLMLLEDDGSAPSVRYMEGFGATPAPSIDQFAILAAAARRWKLIIVTMVIALAATYGAMKFVPSRY